VPSTNGLYTCADLSAVINDANLDVVKDTNALQNIGTVTTVSGTYQYALSATAPDVLQVWGVTWNGLPMTKVGPGDYRWGRSVPKQSGTPRVYRIWNGLIELDPTPDADKDLEIRYTYKPSALAMSTAEPELPSQYHMAIVYRACAYLTIRDEKEMRYNSFFQKYQYELARLRSMLMDNDGSQIPLDTNTGTSLNNWGSIY
jgi:hypothetical protein